MKYVFHDTLLYVVVVTWAQVVYLDYMHEHEGSTASVYISGKSQVPILQLLYSAWVTHLQVGNCSNGLQVY